MTADLIRAQYEQLQAVSVSFDDERDRICALHGRLLRQVDILRRGGWQAEGADDFYRQMDADVLPGVERLRSALEQAGSVTRQIITLLQNAEEDAAAFLRGQGQEEGTPTLPPVVTPVAHGSGHGNTLEMAKAPSPDRKDDPGRKLQTPCPDEPTPSGPVGRKYLDAANATGANPVLLGMIVENEWVHRSFENWVPFVFTLADSNYSYGVGQIQAATAKSMMETYPALFPVEDYPQLYHEDGSINENALKWELFTTESFNLRVAGSYVAHLESTIVNDLAAMGVTVSDTSVPGQATINNLQLDQMVAIAYNQGWDLVRDRLQNDRRTPEDRVRGIEATIAARREHVDNVFRQQDYVQEQIGADLSCY